MTLYMVELRVADVAASAAWYRRLGFTQTTHDPATGFTLLETAGGRVALRPGAATPGVIVHFEVETLGPFDDVKTSLEGYRRAKLTDPDGYQVVLFEWTSCQAMGRG